MNEEQAMGAVKQSTRITLKIPPDTFPAARLMLEQHGAIVGSEHITFPSGTTRIPYAFAAETAHNLSVQRANVSERFKITFPDGFAIEETFDVSRELSILFLPCESMREGDTLVEHLNTLQKRIERHTLYGFLPDGRRVVLKSGTCWIYQGDELTHSWQAETLNALIVVGVQRYAIRLMDIPLSGWKAIE